MCQVAKEGNGLTKIRGMISVECPDRFQKNGAGDFEPGSRSEDLITRLQEEAAADTEKASLPAIECFGFHKTQRLSTQPAGRLVQEGACQ